VAVADYYTFAADAGSAYVFLRSGVTWAQQQKLTASDGAASAFFGSSVAVSRMSRVPWNFGGGPTCLGGYFPIIALR
jgi:hypothetical protein